MSLHSVAALQFWSVILLGLGHFGTQTDARAVNVSNTWTMPQEGLNVFYRFFRDRISWFEADAVCQFHHANLVTVDNSFQFDATRDLLRELDVNDIVWIGLMRPQSAERFMWSNSRPLVTDTGYWAESLPLMDAPLCAVIDPIRDYRWHALRCGGPETASFLCEMPVPSWADACILKDMPNLTMQYMADTASIELIRNCAEEGLLKQSCKGKQDRDRALRELICPRERLEAQRINDITNSHFKSLQIINSIRTDNNENNDIELLPLGETSYGSASNSDISEQMPTEKNTVQRLIEQFNVDELMQADEPSMAMSGYHIPDEIPKPVKKSSKKVIIANNGGDYQKKNRAVKYEEKIELPPPTPKPKKQQQLLALEDMMMGDQPQQSGEPEMLEHVGPEEDEVSNEIMEPLPHKKKVLPQDLKTMAPITEKSSEETIEKSAEKKAYNLKEEMERKVFGGTISAPTVTVTSTTISPTITTTTAATTTTTAAPSSTLIPMLSTSTVISTAKPTEEDTQSMQKAHLNLNTQKTSTSTDMPSTATAYSSSAVPTLVTESEGHSHSSSSTTSPSTTFVPHSTTKSYDYETVTFSTDAPAVIGHPMHPQQQQHSISTEELQHPHVKESVDNSHFIPPMLLVKSHYVPALKHGEHSGNEHHRPGMHEVSHAEHGFLQMNAGKPSDNPVYSMTANYYPTTATTTTHSGIANGKNDGSDVETMTTTTTVTTTMTAIKSTKPTDYDLTKDAIVAKTSTLDEEEEEQQQEKKQEAQLNAKLIDRKFVTANQRQQQNGKQTNIKTQTFETKEMAEKIENSKDIVAKSNEHGTTAAAVTTSASLPNKLHSISTTAAKTTTTTTTTTTLPTTTMKSADVDDVTHDDTQKPVQHESQTKEVEELRKKEMSVKASKIIEERETLLITAATTITKMDDLQTIKGADTTQKISVENPTTNAPTTANPPTTTTEARKVSTTITARAATTTIPTTAKPSSDSLATMTGAPSPTTLDSLTTTTTAATTPATATTPTHTMTSTICSSDTDTDTAIVESTTISDATEESSATETGDGKKLTRVHRTCQPRYEKSNGKHSKHHAKVTVEPPTPTRNFLNEETETPPYKPNRHRVLTKPETVSYFKKIIG